MKIKVPGIPVRLWKSVIGGSVRQSLDESPQALPHSLSNIWFEAKMN